MVDFDRRGRPTGWSDFIKPITQSTKTEWSRNADCRAEGDASQEPPLMHDLNNHDQSVKTDWEEDSWLYVYQNCNMDQQPNSLKDNGLYCFLSVCLYLPVTNHRSKSMGVAVRCPHRHPSIHGGPARDLCYGVLSNSVSCSNTLLNIRHCLSIRCIRWIRNISFYDGRYYWNLDAGLPKYSRLDQAVVNEYRRNDICRSSRQCSGSTYSCFFRCFRIFVSFKNFYHSQEGWANGLFHHLNCTVGTGFL